MAPDRDGLLRELGELDTVDEVLAEVAARCREIVGGLDAVRRIPDFRLFVADFGAASEALRASAFITDSARAILAPPTVVVDAAFLLELETAFRSFDLSDALLDSQYLRGDLELFGLVKRIRADRAGYLARLRRLARREHARDRAYVVETLTLVLLFFVAHEIGHLLDAVDARGYGTFLPPDAVLEGRVANAVVKLCRHADEFDHHGFGLPGAGQVVDEASGIREKERELGREIEILKVNHEAWFRDETSADRQGEEILTAYLAEVAARDPVLADQYRYVAVKGLFAAALYTWYRDLLTFGEKMGMQGAPDGRSLAIRMAQDRETYVRAASLFGDVHRFTLLRAVLACEAILRGWTDFFDRPVEARSIRWSETRARQDAGRRWWQRIFVWRPDPEEADREVLREWWEKESLQRYYLLAILMDTAVKIAHMGCATGWMLDADRRRGTPQPLVVSFESLSAAVDRLRDFA
jgi:hypothetical protein